MSKRPANTSSPTTEVPHEDYTLLHRGPAPDAWLTFGRCCEPHSSATASSASPTRRDNYALQASEACSGPSTALRSVMLGSLALIDTLSISAAGPHAGDSCPAGMMPGLQFASLTINPRSIGFVQTADDILLSSPASTAAYSPALDSPTNSWSVSPCLSAVDTPCMVQEFIWHHQSCSTAHPASVASTDSPYMWYLN